MICIPTALVLSLIGMAVDKQKTLSLVVAMVSGSAVVIGALAAVFSC
jgi:hypothetical protein